MTDDNLKSLVAAALEAKRKVENQINELIYNFEKETGLKCEDIRLEFIETADGSCRMVISNIKVEL